MYGTSALFLIDFISIRVLLEFERSLEECHSWRKPWRVSIRVLLEFERSIFIMKKVKEIVSQSEFCWSLRDHIINNKITSKFLSQSEFCWSLRDPPFVKQYVKQ